MTIQVTRLHQVRNARGQLVVLQPGLRVPDRAVDESTTLDEVAGLKAALGDQYDALVSEGILVELP